MEESFNGKRKKKRKKAKSGLRLPKRIQKFEAYLGEQEINRIRIETYYKRKYKELKKQQLSLNKRDRRRSP